MNERIQELAYQAEDYADSIVDQGGEFHQAYTRKFAELIVRECTNMVEEHQPRYLTRRQAQEMADTIREHFGVEE